MADENKTPTAVSDSKLNEQMLLMEIRQPMADEFNWADFVAIGFSNERYARKITQCTSRYWRIKETIIVYAVIIVVIVGQLINLYPTKH